MNLKNIKTPQIKGQEPLPLIVKLEESGRIDEFFSFFDKKDYIHYCKFSAIKLSDTHFLCFLVDITKLEKTKYKLEQERKLIRDIIDRNPSTITIVDRDGKIVFTNKAGEKILGITLQEIISREYKSPEWKITDLKGQPFHSKDLPFEIVKSTKKPTIVQHAIERANGERIFLSVSAIPIFDNEGKFNGMIATIEDITNRERN